MPDLALGAPGPARAAAAASISCRLSGIVVADASCAWPVLSAVGSGVSTGVGSLVDLDDLREKGLISVLRRLPDPFSLGLLQIRSRQGGNNEGVKQGRIRARKEKHAI